MALYRNWHSHALDKVLKKLGTTKNGLSTRSAKQKLARWGPNELPQEKPLSKIRLFFGQFNTPLMYILLTTVLISFVLGHYSDSIFILIVLLINTLVGFWQENKVNNSLEALKKMVKISVRTRRDGAEHEIDSEQLVVGDVIILQPGDKVPADLRIIKSKNLKANEASLTGESAAVSKKGGVVKKSTIISERSNMLFAGTSIERGEAEAVVVATGINSEFGKIVSLVKHVEEPKTPLQKKIAHLSKLIGTVVLLSIVGIIFAGYFTGKDAEEIFITALALSVSAIPEGLLPAITVVLVLAMRRVLKQKGVVKKLSAAEGLGSVTTLCTDKTGTLTEGKMQVSHVITSDKDFSSEKAKFKEKIATKRHSKDILALKIAALTNDAFIENPEDELHKLIVRGYSTDKALLLGGIRAGLDIQELEKELPLVEKLNFSSRARFAASLRGKGSTKSLFVVGAPEEIFERSSLLDTNGKPEKLGKSELDKLKAELVKLTSKGLRVVACAYRQIEKPRHKVLPSLAHDLTMVGFVALKDPVRKDAKSAMKKIQRAGVHTAIITGDHHLTAKAVAEELGLKVGSEEILEGKDIESMSETELTQKVKKIKIYARALPEHKLKIVEALHHNNEIVAMFGDGVNDAPALKASDIGVAVGSGTDVAKEVADVILLDDSFSTIVGAIEQGRVAFSNIRKVFIFLVADDFTEIVLFLGAMIVGMPLPLLAAQILWINLVEDGFPDIALTTEQETEGVMKQKPRDPTEPIISRTIKKWMVIVFGINSLITFAFFYFLYKYTGDIDKTRTFIFALMAFDSLVFAYSVRSLKQTIFRRTIFSNRFLNWGVLISFVLLIAAIYFPPLQSFLHTVELSLNDWGVVAAITLAELFVIEIFKKLILIEKKL